MTKLLIVARPLFPSLAGVKGPRKTAEKFEELNIGKQPANFTLQACPDVPALFSCFKNTNNPPNQRLHSIAHFVRSERGGTLGKHKQKEINHG